MSESAGRTHAREFQHSLRWNKESLRTNAKEAARVNALIRDDTGKLMERSLSETKLSNEKAETSRKKEKI